MVCPRCGKNKTRAIHTSQNGGITERIRKCREYTDNQGQNKKSYLTIGTLFIYQDGGMSLKLDAMPTNQCHNNRTTITQMVNKATVDMVKISSGK